jgi:two-component system sensor histidine kinase KdpD
LYQFSRKLAVAVTLDDLLWATAHQIALMLKMRVVLLLPGGADVPLAASAAGTNAGHTALSVHAGFPPEDSLDEADMAAAQWAWDHNRPAGRGADTLPGAKRLFMPMQTGRGPIGVIGIDRDDDIDEHHRSGWAGRLLSPDQERLLDALTDQAALAVERVNLVRDIDRARLQAETDRLRSALLTSISHDLRTPLASILGCATSLISPGTTLTEASQAAMLRTIQEEAERLNRFIGNLLDMTRLESGPLPLPGRPVGRDWRGAAPRRPHPRAVSRASRAAARPADAEHRHGAVRTGAVQPAGQCGEIRAAGLRHRHPRAA